MTEKQIRRKYAELRKRTDRLLAAYLDNVLSSKAVDLDKCEDDYTLPKQVLCAALDEVRNLWRPLRREGEREVRDIARRTTSDWTKTI